MNEKVFLDTSTPVTINDINYLVSSLFVISLYIFHISNPVTFILYQTFTMNNSEAGKFVFFNLKICAHHFQRILIHKFKFMMYFPYRFPGSPKYYFPG